MTSIVSFGGGVNSTAMLVGLSQHGERPDYVLFADTKGEKPPTYRHIAVMQEWLKAHEMPPITVVSDGSLEDDCLRRESLPGKAFGFGSCSEHFKVRPQRRYIKQQGIVDPLWLVGFHAGERFRTYREGNQRNDVRFPLIEWGWDQAKCLSVLAEAGIPNPGKSACFYCPAMKKHEVLELKQKHPDLLERAIEMERIAKPNLTTVKGLGRSWAWADLVSADEAQLKLFQDTQAPICDVCVDW